MKPAARRLLMYWITQLAAWGSYVTLVSFTTYLNDEYEPGLGYVMTMVLVIGIGVSHLFRRTILRRRWLAMDIGRLVPRLTLGALLFGLLAFVLQALIHDLIIRSPKPILTGEVVAAFSMLINWTILLFVWSIAYFAYHWFTNSRREEIRNLQLETASRNDQLSNLRRQLNPHFMFNALNGIRALIDEDPARAKQAITQLSAILRNSMMTVRRNTVPLGEELDIVKAYLELEAMRFEERLRVRYEVQEGIDREPVPPMMLQTLVENAVRHGIANIKEGGEVIVGAHRSPAGLMLTVKNSGQYAPGSEAAKPLNGSTGIGLYNTRERLRMLYGAGASLNIHDRNGMVEIQVEIPGGKSVVEDRKVDDGMK